MKIRKNLLLIIMFVFVITLIVLIPNNVFATEEMSEQFKQILNEDGKLVVTDTTISKDKNRFLTEYLSKYSSYTSEAYYYFEVSNYNEENSTCDITISGQVYETHTIEIIYEEKISEEFKRILNEEGKLPISSSSKNGVGNKIDRSLNIKDENYHFSSYGYGYTDDGILTNINMIDENLTKATIRMLNKDWKLLEQHVVELSYLTEQSEEFKKILNEDGKRVINAVKPNKRK